MEIQLWGVRGSIPSPLSDIEYKEKIHAILEQAIDQKLTNKDDIGTFIKSLSPPLQHTFGGNTTCVTVQSASGKQYIIDCGTGIRELGYQLMKGPCGKGEATIDIFLTHNHWDHLQGLPFFTPIYISGNTFRFHSPYKKQDEILNNQMISPYFPATFEGTASNKEYIYIDPATKEPFYPEEGLRVTVSPLKHPGGSFAYKFEENGKTFIFATDAEFTGEVLENLGENTDNYFKGADLLVLDAQYTLDESFMKFDWGHTSFTMAVNCGIRWGINDLVLTHHEPAYHDEKLYENYQLAIEHRKSSGHELPNIHIAQEGKIFTL